MYIRLLSLNNFRNYANLEVELSPGLCIFWGGNGQGKTNLLEAVYFLATTRSFRAETEREVVRWEAWADPIPAGRIVGHIEAGSGPVTLEVVLHAAQRESAMPPVEGQRPLVHKRIRVNGLAKRASDAIGEFIAVLFSAPEIHLVDGSPSHRRRYLDTAAVQVDRRYRQVLARYSQVITQRNSLLKAAQEGRARRDELTFWDDEMVKQGAALMLMRRDLVAEIGPRARDVHAHLTEGREELDVEYRPALPLPAVPSTASVAGAFRRALTDGAERDVAAGMSLVGPHRDDLSFLVKGVDMALYGSRGQQRTIALSMKLAEAEFMEARRGDKPVLILDDVFSELDAPRRRQLMSAVGRFEQVLVTSTDLDPFDDAFLERATIYWVQDGGVETQRLPVGMRERLS